jgi:tetratricopeptide (TPR) repeat protein
LICAGLAGLTLAAFWPVTRGDFVNLDDPTYVLTNVRVQQGVTWENVTWSFSTYYFSNWHPLTWLSYLVDCEIFGVNPRAMHGVSLAWHVANVLLLFGLLKRATGATWPSAVVAALFAVHPLHVESVAWISERKDVLSTFFWISSMWAYCEYVKARCAGWYTAAVALCALGLMCKAMLVTLPFALLLFDLWPLRRLEPGGDAWLRRVAKLVVEKLPFFALAAVTGFFTFVAQQAGEAVIPFEPLSLSARIENAFISYARYLAKTFWPTELAVFYPHPGEWPVMQFVASLALLAGVSAAAIVYIRRHPFLFTGWFWFLGTLVPVIGLVQVGGQSMADRYTYVPSIGLFVALVWLARRVAARVPVAAIATVVTLVLFTCTILTHQQSRLWQDSVTLFTHAARVAPANSVVLNNLGSALRDVGRTADADRVFDEALALDPEDPMVLGNLGNRSLRGGKVDEALAFYQRALQFKSNEPRLHFNAGRAFAMKGEFTNAMGHYDRALELNPSYLDARLELGNVMMALGKTAAAIEHYNRVLKLRPDHAAARYNLGQIAIREGRWTEAVEHLSEAVRTQTNFAAAHRQLAVALQRSGQPGKARQSLESAIAARPTNAVLHAELGLLLAQSGEPKEAISAYRKAIELNQEMFEAANNLAWLLATHPEVLNGPEAVRLAEYAVERGGKGHAFLLGTLAAAYAEAGQFPDAIKTAEEAIELAKKNGQEELARKNIELLAAYREGRPWREEPGSTLLNK